MHQQFQALKAQAKDAILFFRLGDFYEMFDSDAKIGASVLSLTLTGRGKDANRIPMCGIPIHAADGYITKLVHAGYKVAIAEQLSDERSESGLTRREIVRIITPGTLTLDTISPDPDPRIIGAVAPAAGSWGIASIDVSTGEFRMGEFDSESAAISHLGRLQPVELVCPAAFDPISLPNFRVGPNNKVLITKIKSKSETEAWTELCAQFNCTTLHHWGFEVPNSGTIAAELIIRYLTDTQKSKLAQITKIGRYPASVLGIDRATMHHLKITGNDPESLVSVLNFTQTPMGYRQLQSWLVAPSLNPTEIEWRYDAIDSLLTNRSQLATLRQELTEIGDLARLIPRCVSGRQNPRDLIALVTALTHAVPIRAALESLSGKFQSIFAAMTDLMVPTGSLMALCDIIKSAIVPSPPTSLAEGGVIRSGYDTELDQLTASFADIKTWINGLESAERAATEIKSLKVKYNKVFGYFIEIPQSQQTKIPPHYIRRQTTVNTERYITPELKEKELILARGADHQIERETHLYSMIIAKIESVIDPLKTLAAHLAIIDSLQSLASAAIQYHYCRPTIAPDDTLELSMINGRHPTLAPQLGENLIANTVSMTATANRFMLITGPNMAGKSTVMRQTALLMVMAQSGSFVPATQFRYSLADQIFTRIGASDDLSAGHSTFMVEMIETAAIINTATNRSIIILDEIGRGTATFDGMSIAYAVSDYIHTHIGARTMFATHYHELTRLADQYPEIENWQMRIGFSGNRLVFHYELVPDATDQSYGIHVARMAGIPDVVIDTASRILDGLRAHGVDYLDAPPTGLSI